MFSVNQATKRARVRLGDGMTRHALWGVSLNGETGLLFKGWHPGTATPRYDGEPSEPLLFRTRRQAQAWCRERHAFYRRYPIGHACRTWRFTVIGVLMGIHALTILRFKKERDEAKQQLAAAQKRCKQLEETLVSLSGIIPHQHCATCNLFVYEISKTLTPTERPPA